MSARAAERLLDVRGLRAGYAGVPVVHDVDLSVDACEVVALLGPNGAGKTTTLVTLSGLVPLLGGEVTLLGSRLPVGRRRRGAALPLALVRRGLAHVPEDRALFFGLTGREHLRLVTGRDDTAIAAAVAPFPALAEVLDRRAGLMSGGEQQMLALARALAARPRLLLIDELSLGLAPIVVEQLLPLVGRIAREQGIGVLIVEQHAHSALAVADRAYVMVRGSIGFEGPAQELTRDAERLQAAYLDGR